MTRRDFVKPAFSLRKLRENTCTIASGDYSTPVSQRWSMFYIVSTTELAAISPLLYAKTLEQHLPIKVHYLTDVEKIELSLYWREIETQDPGHKWLRELIKEM